jgi:hypothetical protein
VRKEMGAVFWWKSQKEEKNWKDLDVVRRIRLKRILEK